MKDNSMPLLVFAAAVIAGGAAILIAGLLRWDNEDLLFLLALSGGVVLTEMFDFSPFPNSRVSISIAAVLAAGIFAGLPGVAHVSLATAAADQATHRKPLIKAVFNFSAIALAGAAFLGTIDLVSDSRSAGDWTGLLAPVTIGSIVAFAVNSTLVAAVISLSGGGNALSVWNQSFRWVLPYYLLLGLLALSLASAYDRWEVAGLLLVAAPLAAVWLAVREHLQHPPQLPASRRSS